MIAGAPTAPYSSSRDRPCAAKRCTPASEHQPEPCTKRSKAFLLRAGSVESECTNLEGVTAARPALTAADGGGHGGKSIPWGSAESQRSILQAPHVLGSGGTDAEDTGLNAPPSAGGAAAPLIGAATVAAPRPAAMAAEWHQQPEQPRELMSREFLAELAAANACLKRLPLPGGVPFSPVHPSCALLPLLDWYHTPPAAIALGASYFQRLLASCRVLADDAVAAGFFSYQPGAGGQMEAVMHGRPGDSSLLSILCTCVYLGIKVCEGPQWARQLSHMLGSIHEERIPSAEAADLEMKCLKKLDWRLGPYCCQPGRAAPAGA